MQKLSGLWNEYGNNQWNKNQSEQNNYLSIQISTKKFFISPYFNIVKTYRTHKSKAPINNLQTFCFISKSSLFKILFTLSCLWEIVPLQPLRLDFFGIKFLSHPCSQFPFLIFHGQDNNIGKKEKWKLWATMREKLDSEQIESKRLKGDYLS